MLPMPYFDGRALMDMRIPLLRSMIITCFEKNCIPDAVPHFSGDNAAL